MSVYAYRPPFTADVAHVLERVTTFDSSGDEVFLSHMITGADMHPSGNRLLLRVYAGVFEYRALDGTLDGLDDAPRTDVVWGPVAETQGEAVSYAANGVDAWSISEGVSVPLHHYVCEQ